MLQRGWWCLRGRSLWAPVTTINQVVGLSSSSNCIRPNKQSTTGPKSRLTEKIRWETQWGVSMDCMDYFTRWILHCNRKIWRERSPMPPKSIDSGTGGSDKMFLGRRLFFVAPLSVLFFLIIVLLVSVTDYNHPPTAVTGISLFLS